MKKYWRQHSLSTCSKIKQFFGLSPTEEEDVHYQRLWMGFDIEDSYSPWRIRPRWMGKSNDYFLDLLEKYRFKFPVIQKECGLDFINLYLESYYGLPEEAD